MVPISNQLFKPDAILQLVLLLSFALGGNAERPLVRSDQCNPITSMDCPAYTKCFKTGLEEFTCRCWGYLGLTEGDDETCRMMPIIWPLIFILFAVNLVLFANLFFEVVKTVIQLKKENLFRNNCAGRLLIFITANSFCDFGFLGTMFLIFLGLDKSFSGYDDIRPVFVMLNMICIYAVEFEAVIAWIDLTQKTISLSRTSSKKLDYTRKAIRLFVFVDVVYSSILYFSGDLAKGALLNIFVLFILLLTLIFSGYNLTKIICPDRKDTSNPNFAPAEAIRKTYIFQALWLFLMFTCIYMLVFTGTMHKLSHISMIIGTQGWQICLCLKNYQWLSYVRFGNRKALEKYKTVGLSKFMDKFTTPVDRKSSQVEPELQPVAEEQA